MYASLDSIIFLPGNQIFSMQSYLNLFNSFLSLVMCELLRCPRPTQILFHHIPCRSRSTLIFHDSLQCLLGGHFYSSWSSYNIVYFSAYFLCSYFSDYTTTRKVILLFIYDPLSYLTPTNFLTNIMSNLDYSDDYKRSIEHTRFK